MTEKHHKYCRHCAQRIYLTQRIHDLLFCTNKNSSLDSEGNMLSNQNNQGKEKSKFYKTLDISSRVLSHLFTLPVFLILHNVLPDPDWSFHLDRILIFVFSVLFVEFLYHRLKIFAIAGILMCLLYLTFGSISGKYGFVQFYMDYKTIIHNLNHNAHSQYIIISKLSPFHHKAEVIKAVDYNDPVVRDFALMAINKNFVGINKDPRYRTIIQCFAVFKEINSRWVYVSDPKSREYFAKASESVRYLSGDCDDHSILMAACLKAIGGTPRLIHTTNHMYPELYIGKKDDLPELNLLIREKLFPVESIDKDIHYHIDENNQVWLNLDYTAKYPGGPFKAEEILGALTFD